MVYQIIELRQGMVYPNYQACLLSALKTREERGRGRGDAPSHTWLCGTPCKTKLWHIIFFCVSNVPTSGDHKVCPVPKKVGDMQTKSCRSCKTGVARQDRVVLSLAVLSCKTWGKTDLYKIWTSPFDSTHRALSVEHRTSPQSMDQLKFPLLTRW
jgi:hypothetical protein